MKTPIGAGRPEVAELTRHKEVLIERLAVATDRYERIAYEGEIAAVEALIAGLSAHLYLGGAR